MGLKRRRWKRVCLRAGSCRKPWLPISRFTGIVGPAWRRDSPGWSIRRRWGPGQWEERQHLRSLQPGWIRPTCHGCRWWGPAAFASSPRPQESVLHEWRSSRYHQQVQPSKSSQGHMSSSHRQSTQQREPQRAGRRSALSWASAWQTTHKSRARSMLMFR